MSSMRARAVMAVALLVVLWIGLPIALPGPASGPASMQCLTLPDAPPDRSRADLIPVLEQCSALNPTDVELMADLGSSYEAHQRPADAEAVYRRALLVDPGYADTRMRLAKLLLARGDAPAARREAEAALRIQPNRASILEFLRTTEGSR